MHRYVLALIVSMPLLAGGLIRACGAPAPPSLNLPAARLWTAAGATLDVAADGREVWVASGGGLTGYRDGRVVERVREPEIAWRAVALHGDDVAAVGIRSVTWRHAGRWARAKLPVGVEGHTIAADPTGWWVGHSRGVSRLDPASGLGDVRPLGPVRRLVGDGRQAWALGTGRFYRLPGGEAPPPPGAKGPWAASIWKGRLVVAGSGGDQPLALWQWADGWRSLPAVPGRGSHVTALAEGPPLTVAVAGDGWYEYGGGKWRAVPGVPEALARDASALTAAGGGQVGGARGGGLWQLRAGRWHSLSTHAELPAANIQALGEYGGHIYASTFDQGLLRRTAEGWASMADPSAPRYPRQLAAADGRLFVRETDGTLSVFDGSRWERNILRHQLKRSWIGTLAATPGGLTLGGWGTVITGLPGAWTEAPLPPPWKDQGLTALAPLDGRLAFGTGKRGMALLDVQTGTVAPARRGPSDPWITALLATGSGILAGTASGQLGWDGGEAGEALAAPITALASIPGGDTLAVTRDGLYALRRDRWQPLECPHAEALEPQCILVTTSSVWIGGRHGILQIPLTGS